MKKSNGAEVFIVTHISGLGIPSMTSGKGLVLVNLVVMVFSEVSRETEKPFITYL